ncbi:hypothetical protein EYR40_010594 [Pleurotus pulmonarius]|nr:hypothetical protein EYR40_010594 [Pleurotus pulmonarius]
MACSRKYLQLQAAAQLEPLAPVDGVQNAVIIDDFEMLEPAAFNNVVPLVDDPGEIPLVVSTQTNDNTDVTDRPDGPKQDTNPPDGPQGQTPWSPFLSATVARLLCWFHSGSTQKSNNGLDSLVKNVLLKKDFDTADLHGFSTTVEHNRVDDALKLSSNRDAASNLFPATSGWEKKSVTISLPALKVKQTEVKAPMFEIKDVLIRPLLSVMWDTFQGPEFSDLHLMPFEECWVPSAVGKQEPDLEIPSCELFSDVPPGHQRTYGEIYTSRSMMDAFTLKKFFCLQSNI